MYHIKGTILGIMNKRYIQHLTAQDVGQGHVSITSFGERQALRDSCALTDKANQNHTKEGADGELVMTFGDEYRPVLSAICQDAGGYKGVDHTEENGW